jgi:hypothetical protein
MIGIALSPEQIKAAPPEVRRWIERELASSLGFLAQIDRQSPPARSELAACSREEAFGVFELIKDDYLTCQVFFELGRGAEGEGNHRPLFALSIAEIMRHARIHSTELQRSFAAINQALQQIRHDPHVSLFGFDEDGHCYIHQDTHRNIGRLWQEFVASQAQRSMDREAGIVSPKIDLTRIEPQPVQMAQGENAAPTSQPGLPGS